MFSIDFNVFVLVAGIAVGAFGWQWIYARIAQAKVLAEAELSWVKAKLELAEAKLASFMPAFSGRSSGSPCGGSSRTFL